MKANRKFVRSENAVSAVIGVILMVAITVAIAATVYVYVSGMISAPSTSTPSAILKAYDGTAQAAAGVYVANAEVFYLEHFSGAQLRWSDLKFQYDAPSAGTTWVDLTTTAAAGNLYYTAAPASGFFTVGDRMGVLAGDGTTVSGTYSWRIIYIPSQSQLLTATIVTAV